MQNFHDYITADYCGILHRLLAKERVKQGSKHNLKRDKKEIQKLMPPRNKWLRLHQRIRCKDMCKETANILSICKTIASDIKRYGTGASEKPEYLTELIRFTDSLADIAVGNSTMPFSKADFSIIPKFKGDEGDDAIYRPLCVYTNLKTKVLISAASAYFTQSFDPYLHTEILSYRPRRQYHGKMTTTNGNHAIKAIKEYIKRQRGKNIYVAECDIQKFFDIINHDVVLDCFDRLAQKAGIPDYEQARNILKQYLDSYGFVPDVLSLNENENYWKNPLRLHRGKVKGRLMFKWVNEDDFMQAYSKEEFAAERNHLGVPQGGALSCVISNVVLNDVDQVIVANPDPDRLFVRYGDDIILMHTDREKCEDLLEKYKKGLLDHKLIFHKFEDFADLKDGEKNTKKFWKGKSKPVFLWGKGEGNASEWIGFVGYEIHREGHTRLRLSTLDKKFNDVNRKYHKCLNAKHSSCEKHVANVIERMETLPESLAKFSELESNIHLQRQLRRLDKFRYRKLEKLDTKLSKKYNQEVQIKEVFESNEGVSFFKKIGND